MKKIWKKVCGLFLLATVCVVQMSSYLQVQAKEISYVTKNGVVDFGEGDASICVKGNLGQSLSGKKLEVYHLFEAENAVGLESIDYMMNPLYAEMLKTVVGSRLLKESDKVTEYEILDYMQSLNSHIVEGAKTNQILEGRYSDYRYFVEELAAQFQQNQIKGIEIGVTDTKADGSIELAGLQYGYYMIADVSEVDGRHTALSMPMLSTANPEAEVKIKADYPILVEKIQEDDNRDVIGQEGWNDIADYEIGQFVPLRYQSNIPNINGYHTYYYAWHTNMNEALTMQPESIQICIQGQKNEEEITYQLEPEEYQLVTDTSKATFIIQIKDIKQILDREFPNQNEKKENIYGQEVTVTYLAVLNHKAALDTGRPGFENDVRLEFSNNPNQGGEGKTGFTAWDSVVCFTYQLNGLKTNNYGMNLEDAKFRLYLDEACEKEVLVRKVADRYHVMHPDTWTDEVLAQSVEMISDENGEFNIYGLDCGVYYLKETHAPTGYRPLLEPVKITITAAFPKERNQYVKGDGADDKLLDLSVMANIKTFQNGKEKEEQVSLTVDANKGSMQLQIINEIGEKLPITGSYAMALMGILGVSLMGIAWKRGRKLHE